jgi:hypothetical protein
MYSYNYIQEIVKTKTRTAKAQRLQPFFPCIADFVEALNGNSYARAKFANIPFLGTYVPAKWERVKQDGCEKQYFVDTTSLGERDEPALTFDAFVEEAYEDFRHNPKHGYAIVKIGEFQAYIGVFNYTGAPAIANGD